MENRGAFFRRGDIPAAAVYSLRLFYDYKCILDDFIQYGVYSLREHPVRDIFIDAGTFTTRPAANLSDIIIYSKFWDFLYIPYAFITVLYFVFILMLRKTLEYMDIPLGKIFVWVCALCPLNIEGIMWLSASTRIVPGLFFGCAAVFCVFCDKFKARMFLFWILNLAAMLFYEQAAVFALLLAFLVSFCLKKPRYALISVLNICAVAVYYLTFRNTGSFSYRTSGVSLPDIPYFFGELRSMLKAASYVFFENLTCVDVAAAAAVAVGVAVCVKNRCAFSAKKIVFGVAVTAFTFFPIAVTRDYIIPFRYLAVPLVGAAVLLDSVSIPILRRIIFSAAVVLFIPAGVREYMYYCSSAQKDMQLVGEIASIVQTYPGNTVSVSGGRRYYRNSKSNHAEHIAAITSSDWALTGAVRAYSKNPYFPMIELGESAADIHITLTDGGEHIGDVRINNK